VQMPGMDGLEATAAMRRAEPPDSHTFIYALTAHAMAGDRDACLTAGMDGYLSKPIEVGDLMDVLATVSENRPSLEPVIQRPLSGVFVGPVSAAQSSAGISSMLVKPSLPSLASTTSIP